MPSEANFAIMGSMNQMDLTVLKEFNCHIIFCSSYFIRFMLWIWILKKAQSINDPPVFLLHISSVEGFTFTLIYL